MPRLTQEEAAAVAGRFIRRKNQPPPPILGIVERHADLGDEIGMADRAACLLEFDPEPLAQIGQCLVDFLGDSFARGAVELGDLTRHFPFPLA